MNALVSVYKREIRGYFATPVAYVFLVIFLIISAVRTFSNGFFPMGQADLHAFFQDMPIIFLLFAPAIAMRLWAEERRSNSIEFLFTLPISTWQAVLAKYLAAWTVIALAMALTFPMVLTVTYLGDPDPGPIITAYIGCLLLAGTYLAIGSFFSAATRNQVIAFVLAVVAAGILLLLGNPTVMNFLAHSIHASFAEAMEILSLQTRFESMQRGVLEVRDVTFFAFLIGGWLWANMVLLEERRAA